jgi:aldehyde dehydrogenase (NAD(P)+)
MVQVVEKEDVRPFGEYDFVPVVPGPPPSSRREMDSAVERLAEGAPVFAALSIRERLDLVNDIQRGLLRTAPAAVSDACRAKGIAAGSPLEGEEWASGPVVAVRQLRLLRESLQALARSGSTPTGPVREFGEGRLAVGLFPMGRIDRTLLRGAAAEAYLAEGVNRRELAESRAPFYRGVPHGGKVVLVLGGGNIAAVSVTDVLTKLFNEGKVCILKMNPVNAYLGPHLEEAFAGAIERNFLAVLYGGGEEGAYLCDRPGIDEVHVTGSNVTYDAIVWGPPGPESAARRAAGTPLFGKKITSELGNVSPVIVVPGPYSDRELWYQAGDVAGYATMNASFLCNAAKMLVTARKWEGRVPFIRHLQDFLARVPTRSAYYPGAEGRWQRFIKGEYRLRTFGGSGQGRLPWALATWIDPESSSARLYREEAFCPVIGETSVGTPDPEEFLDAAVDFVNGKLWGTLSASLIVHPATMKEPSFARAVERAIERLRYGTVAVNAFPGMAYALGSPPWGAWQDSTPEDIQSGHGWVHNTSMLERVEKVVFRHPLTTFPRPPYFPNHRSYRILMRRMAALEERGAWSKVPGVVLAALRG